MLPFICFSWFVFLQFIVYITCFEELFLDSKPFNKFAFSKLRNKSEVSYSYHIHILPEIVAGGHMASRMYFRKR